MATMVTDGQGTHIPTLKLVTRPKATPLAPAKPKVLDRRRTISPQAGRALEMLGHAIEYLYDEFTLESISGNFQNERGTNSRIVAIDLLKRLNRDIYYSCPFAPTLGERIRSLFQPSYVRSSR